MRTFKAEDFVTDQQLGEAALSIMQKRFDTTAKQMALDYFRNLLEHYPNSLFKVDFEKDGDTAYLTLRCEVDEEEFMTDVLRHTCQTN